MSNPTGKTYTFATFQEMVNVVPADRIKDCLDELGTVFKAAICAGKAIYEIGEQNGHAVPKEERRLILPERLEWIDDGKRELGCYMLTEDGKPILNLDFKPKEA